MPEGHPATDDPGLRSGRHKWPEGVGLEEGEWAVLDELRPAANRRGDVVGRARIRAATVVGESVVFRAPSQPTRST